MKPLSLVDQLFLWAEHRQQPMHVGGLMLFSFPEGMGPAQITRQAEHLRSYTAPQPPFSHKLVNKMGRYYWDYDDHFDLEHHFRHQALPKPGRIRELLAWVSAEHSHLLDRTRPLWECYLIEGVRGKRFALYTKAHHSMIDGVSAMRMLARALSESESVRDMPPFWAMPAVERGQARAVRSQLNQILVSCRRAGKQATTLPAVMKEVTHSFYEVYLKKHERHSDYVSIFQAPQSILNQSLTGSRRFAAQSYGLDRIRALADGFDATINDIILAICGSALRDYLISKNALPDEPLIALVPMSIRRDQQSEGGNEVAGILANLGTHIADPVNRLRVIRASVQQAKQRYADMTPAEILNYTAVKLMPAVAHMSTGVLPKWQAFNVVISNVPGPTKPLYWNGAPLEGMYPISIPVNQIALNITTVSYLDQMEFGLTACRRSLPSMQRLLDYIENGIKELETALDGAKGD